MTTQLYGTHLLPRVRELLAAGDGVSAATPEVQA